MKTSSLLLLLTLGLVQFSCGQNIKGIVKQIPGQLPTQLPSNQKPALSNEEVISGLKEALQVGIKNSVTQSSALDGFLGNPQIRLPFPPDALKVKEKALQLGMNNQVEQFETTLNRAAEEAVKEALPIFTQAILNMSVQDGFAILKGGNGAATNFLKNQTSQQLYNAFLPKVKEATAKVSLTAKWTPLMTKYNQAMALTGGEKINPDLDAFVTERAIAGLFTLVQQEEDKIRQNPAARVTDLLAKVFGSLTN
ncbi:MAG: DUF4197 domain-containing protein [Flavobacteriales bacterium]